MYHIDIDNGLPANHVYYMIKDSHGYLWFATTKGVVRYNGYECKIFNFSSGLPTEDVWYLFEDKKGKIWLGDISDEVGYIYRNKYHRTIIPKDIHFFYPKFTADYKNGVIFKTLDDKGGSNMYGIVQNDTLYTSSKFDFTRYGLFLSVSGGVFILDYDSLYHGEVVGQNVIKHGLCKIDSNIFIDMHANAISFAWANHLFHYTPKSDSFTAINLRNGRVDIVRTGEYLHKSSPIYLMSCNAGNRHVNAITESSILQFDDDTLLKCTGLYSIRSLTDDSILNGSSVTSFMLDSLWGKCIITNKGFYISRESKIKFLFKKAPELANSKFIGKISEHTSYWWDNSHATLTQVRDNKFTTTRKVSYLSKLQKILPYSNDTCLVLNEGGIYNSVHWYMPGSGRFVNATDLFGSGAVSAVVYNHSNIFIASKTGFYVIAYQQNRTRRQVFDVDRYEGLVYDSVRQNFLAYNQSKVFIRGHDDKDYIISKDQLANLGLEQLEKIIIDNSYGNIFFKSNEKLVMYNYETRTSTQLFADCKFAGSLVDIYHNTLVVAGRHGILFSKILGVGKISPPVVYNNVKNNYYNYVSDMQLAMNNVLLNTDKGTFFTEIPADSILTNNLSTVSQAKYKFLLSYRDSVIDIRVGDTLTVDQRKPAIELDLINPLGNGKVRYLYHLNYGDTQWHELNSNVLNLPSLPASSYTKLTLAAYDDVFRSKDTDVYLFVLPYWWQTNTGKSFIALLAACFLAISVLVTRKIVLEHSKKRNLQMEMELRSIYAQLNPHFVFNALNSALNMIKKEELDDASTHISKFARLLRSYLDSSRNRFTTLAAEIGNIRNYLEIQQTRFADIFTFEIILGENITQPEKVIIPALLLQPIVENAIHHGLLPKEKNGHLRIEFNSRNAGNEINCVIDDNGIGRRKSKLLNKDSTPKKESHGANLVNELIAVVNKYEKYRIEISYFDKEEPLSGTTVLLKIKKHQHGKVQLHNN